MLFVICSVVHFIVPASCDRPSLSFDQSLALESRVSIDLKKHNSVASRRVNHTVTRSSSLQDPNEDIMQFNAKDGLLGFKVKRSSEGKYIVESVKQGSKASNADLREGMQIVRINRRPVEDMKEQDVLSACKHSKEEELNLVVLRTVTSHPNLVMSEEELKQLHWTDTTISNYRDCCEDCEPHAPLSLKQYKCVLDDHVSGRVEEGEEKQYIIDVFTEAAAKHEAMGSPPIVSTKEDEPQLSLEDYAEQAMIKQEAEEEEMNKLLTESVWTDQSIAKAEKLPEGFDCLKNMPLTPHQHLSKSEYLCLRKGFEKHLHVSDVNVINNYIRMLFVSSDESGEIGGHNNKSGEIEGHSNKSGEIGGTNASEEIGDMASSEELKQCHWSRDSIELYQEALEECHWEPEKVAGLLDTELSPAQYSCLFKFYEGKLPNDEVKKRILESFESKEIAKPNSAPSADSHSVGNGSFASAHLQHEFCQALHLHQHLRLSTKSAPGPPIYTESTAPTKGNRWELYLICPRAKTDQEVNEMPKETRDTYEAYKETAFVVVQVGPPKEAGKRPPQKTIVRATFLADKAKMIFNKEQHSLSMDLGSPLTPEEAYPRIGEEVRTQLEIPEVLQHAENCRLVARFYFLPTWDENALAKGELVPGASRTDIAPTLQCCTSPPCSESDGPWWKTFV